MIFLSISFLGYSVYLLEKNKVLGLRYEQLTTLVHFKKREIISISKSWKNTVNLLASRTQFRVLLSKYMYSPDDEYLRKINKILSDAMISNRNISQILICSLSGVQVFMIGERKIKNACWSPGLVTINPEIWDIWSGRKNRLYVSLRKHVLLNKKKIAYIYVVLKGHGLQDISTDYTGFGKSGEVLIAKRSGVNAQYITPVRFSNDSGGQPEVPLSSGVSPIAIAFKKKSEFLNSNKYVDYRGVPVLSATEYIPELDWALVAKMDRNEALSVAGLARAIVGYFIIISFGIALISLLMARFLTEPLKQLTSTVEVIKAGNWRKRAQVHSSDELGYLAETFNDMLDVLENKVFVIEKQNKTLTLFAKALTHDLKEPIRTIKTVIKMVDKDKSVGAQEELFQIIRMATDNMYLLVETVFVYVKLSNNADIKMKLCDTNKVIEQLQEQLAEELSRSDVEFSFDNMPEIRVNERLFLQLLQHLVENSLRYGDKPVTNIGISWVQIKDGYEFRVKDNGPGVEKQFLKTIFEPFKRVSRENKSGAGLGLAICERIAECHNGKIWCESRVGEGSSFFFTIKNK